MRLIKPYYEHAGITIYNADCRDVLPHLPKVDLVLTDPPYGMAFQSNHRHVKHDRIVGDESLPIDVITQLIKLPRVACYVFCRWSNFNEMPRPRSVIAWIKNNWSMGDLAHEHGRQWEACCFYPGADHAFIKRIPDVIFEDRTGNGLHPTEKPVPLLGKIIAANIGGLVLDPFMGSGTTLVAAKQLGRRAIGIEIESKYCDIAIKRLEQEILPLDMPQKIEKRHRVADSLLLDGMTTSAQDNEV